MNDRDLITNYYSIKGNLFQLLCENNILIYTHEPCALEDLETVR